MKAAIFDIDGVLAETLPRVRIHLWEKTKPDWDSFYADQRYDKPIPWTFTFMRALAEDGYKIALLTGRPAQFRVDTIQWLHENDARYHLLWLRGDDDYRPPQEAKLEQLQKLRKRGWDVELAFEDHPETIQMFLDEGLMVYITPHFFSWKEGEVGRAGEKVMPGSVTFDENLTFVEEPVEIVVSPKDLLKIEKAIKESLDVEGLKPGEVGVTTSFFEGEEFSPPYCEVGDFECGPSRPGEPPSDAEETFSELEKVQARAEEINANEAEGGNIDAPYNPNDPPCPQWTEDGCPTEYSSEAAKNFLEGLEPIEMVADAASLKKIEEAIRESLSDGVVQLRVKGDSHETEESTHGTTDID